MLKNVITLSAKSVSINDSKLTTAASATDAALQKKTFGSGMTALIQRNKESGLLIKDVTEASKNKVIELKSGFFGMLLDTLAASLLGNMLAGKGVI